MCKANRDIFAYNISSLHEAKNITMSVSSRCRALVANLSAEHYEEGELIQVTPNVQVIAGSATDRVYLMAYSQSEDTVVIDPKERMVLVLLKCLADQGANPNPKSMSFKGVSWEFVDYDTGTC